MESTNGKSAELYGTLFLSGAGTPSICCIMTSISTNFLGITFSSGVLGKEKRFTLLVNGGVSPAPNDACRDGLTLEIGGSG